MSADNIATVASSTVPPPPVIALEKPMPMSVTKYVILCGTGTYLSLFLVMSYLGGLNEAKSFLESTQNFHLSLVGAFLDLIPALRDFIKAIILSIAIAIVEVIEALAKHLTLSGVCAVLFTGSLIAGMVHDKETVYDVARNVYPASREAVIGIWSAVKECYPSFFVYTILLIGLLKMDHLKEKVATPADGK